MPKSTFITITAIWLILVTATAYSWTVGTEQFPSASALEISSISLLLVAMFKVRLVIRYFMEVRGAPLALRLLCDAWVVIVGAGLTGMYALR